MVHGSPVWLGSAGSAFQRLGQRADPLLGSEDCLRHSRGTMQSETRLKKTYSNVNMLIWNVPSSNSTWFNVWFTRRYQFQKTRQRSGGCGAAVGIQSSRQLKINMPKMRSTPPSIYIYINLWRSLSLSICIYIDIYIYIHLPGESTWK